MVVAKACWQWWSCLSITFSWTELMLSQSICARSQNNISLKEGFQSNPGSVPEHFFWLFVLAKGNFLVSECQLWGRGLEGKSKNGIMFRYSYFKFTVLQNIFVCRWIGSLSIASKCPMTFQSLSKNCKKTRPRDLKNLQYFFFQRVDRTNQLICKTKLFCTSLRW